MIHYQFKNGNMSSV